MSRREHLQKCFHLIRSINTRQAVSQKNYKNVLTIYLKSPKCQGLNIMFFKFQTNKIYRLKLLNHPSIYYFAYKLKISFLQISPF